MNGKAIYFDFKRLFVVGGMIILDLIKCSLELKFEALELRFVFVFKFDLLLYDFHCISIIDLIINNWLDFYLLRSI